MTTAISRMPYDHPRILSVVASEVAAELIDEYPWICNLDEVAISQYCRMEAFSRMVWEEVQAYDTLADCPTKLLQELTKANTAAMKAAEAIGLNPKGRIALQRDMAVGRQANVATVSSIEALRKKGAGIRKGEVIDA
jgi:hypothetical protein